jgi:hypothetical protein
LELGGEFGRQAGQAGVSPAVLRGEAAAQLRAEWASQISVKAANNGQSARSFDGEILSGLDWILGR